LTTRFSKLSIGSRVVAHLLGGVLAAIGERVADVVAEVRYVLHSMSVGPSPRAGALDGRLALANTSKKSMPSAIHAGNAVARRARREVADVENVVFDGCGLAVAVVLDDEQHGT